MTYLFVGDLNRSMLSASNNLKVSIFPVSLLGSFKWLSPTSGYLPATVLHLLLSQLMTRTCLY